MTYRPIVRIFNHPQPLIKAIGRCDHAYVINAWTPTKGFRVELVVDANNRAQAARAVERHGYTVRDVNMVG